MSVLQNVGIGGWVAAACLVLLALAHSILGEAALLRPLFADRRWSCEGIPRGPAEAVLRGAWHLTSLFWIGLAAALLGAPVSLATAGACLVAAAVVLVKLRGHLSWPLFLLGGLASLEAGGWLPEVVPQALLGAGGVVATVAAAAHLYWALGGRAGFTRAIPTNGDGKPLFAPGWLACTLVALALGVFAALMLDVADGASAWWARAALAVAAAVLALRAVGDGRYVGFSKASHASAFARADDAVFTPLVVVLAFGALAAFHLGAA